LLLVVLLCRWDTTSLSDSPSTSGEPSPDDSSGPTCEELLQQHEQQQALAPLPRMDKALPAPQHDVQLLHARGEVQGLLQQMQVEGEDPGRDLQLSLQQQHILPGKKAKGGCQRC
jgi:hypothetical protein